MFLIFVSDGNTIGSDVTGKSARCPALQAGRRADLSNHNKYISRKPRPFGVELR
jgi:hypothetical protein